MIAAVVPAGHAVIAAAAPAGRAATAAVDPAVLFRRRPFPHSLFVRMKEGRWREVKTEVLC